MEGKATANTGTAGAMNPRFYRMVAVGWFCLAASVLRSEPLPPETALDLESFVQRAARNDTEFEAILLDEMALQYRKTLALPPDDLVLSVKQEYQAFVSQDRAAGATEIGLGKLFPGTGTGISATYGASPSFTTDDTASEISVSLSQPIARNAFGRSTRLLDRIIGLEVEVAHHQVVEAYEDYLAAVMTAFHDWHEAFGNLAIARSSYEENLKLLDNIREREKQQVARPIDVNKIDLQVLARKERTVELETQYRQRLHAIERIVRHDGRTTLVPQPSQAGHLEESFSAAFASFMEQSRTASMLQLLEKKSALEVDREADDLLPSLSLVLSYDVRGSRYDLQDSDNRALVGVSLEWPFPSREERAEHEVAKIDLKKAGLLRVNTRHRLHQDIRNLYDEIRKEKALIELATRKLALAQSVLEDETENYSYGRVSLNDYISAVNVLDNNRFGKVLHEARHRKLMTEWLRLTDRLITRAVSLKQHPRHDRDDTADRLPE